jgi:predicted amidohydrolase YtcJ
MIASLIIKDAHVVTMERPGARAQSLAVEAGRIVAVGTNAEIEPLIGPETLVLSLPGRTVLPGFIDCHVHLTQTGLGALGPSVYDVTDADRVLEVVSDAAARAATDEPLLVHGCWINGLSWPVYRPDLDRMAPRNPVMLVDVGGHACLVNSAAWDRLQLPPETNGVGWSQPGESNGRLAAQANTLARYSYYQFIDDSSRAAALHRAAEMALRVGITTVHTLDGGGPDGHSWFPERDAQVLLQVRDRLPVRTVVYLQSTCVDKAVEWHLPRIGGCVWVDGSYGEHTTALREPYADRPDTRGILYFSDQELNRFVEQAHTAGLQISMHAIGDAAIEQLLDAYEGTLRRHPLTDHRHRIEHFSLPIAGQIERAARLGIALSMQPNLAAMPTGTHRHQVAAMRYLGPERYQWRHPYRKILDAGCLVGGGSDSDPRPMGPLIGVQAVASHPDDDRRLTAYEALTLYTINAARLAFEENQKGTLEPGKLADLVVLGQDPLAADPEAISRIPVEMTLVAGQIVYES